MTLVSQSKVGQSQLVTAKKTKNRTISVRALRLRYDLQDPLTTDRAIAEILAAYEESQGDASGPGSASDRLGVSYKVLWGLVRSNEVLQEKVREIRVRFGNHWAEDSTPDGDDPEA